MSTPSGPRDLPERDHSAVDEPTRTMPRVDRRPGGDTHDDLLLDRRSVLRREKEAFGGVGAGRMARFNGMKQGIAVWLWAVAAAGLVGMRFHRQVDKAGLGG